MKTLKELESPPRLLPLERLVSRTHNHHPTRPTMEKTIERLKAGYRGEKEVAYQLKRLTDFDCYVLHGLRLEYNGLIFQIDTLLITRKFILIIEAKNMYGTIFFDTTFNQMIRQTNELEEGFRNALSQISYHEEQLELWLITNGFGNLPIESLVAFSSPSTILRTNDENNFIHKKVTHAQNLVQKIRELDRKYTSDAAPPLNPELLCQALLSNHSIPSSDIFTEFKIDKRDIISGVQCPSCSAIAMGRKRGTWFCSTCNATSKNAHEQAIIDYLLLVNPIITNTQCRDFLQVTSIHTAHYLLTSMDLARFGNTKGRRYQLAPN